MRLFFVSCLVVCLLFAPCALAADNMLRNPSFETLQGDLPADWAKDMWLWDGGESQLRVAEEGLDGSRCAFVENIVTNDARFVQWVDVEPDTLYRLSGYIKAEGLDPAYGNGASLSVIGSYNQFPEVYDTAGEWELIECFMVTAEEQHRIQVAVRVGDYAADNTGKAWFDNISLEKAEAVPLGFETIYLMEYADTSVATEEIAPEEEAVNFEGIVVWTLLFAALLVLLWVWRVRGFPGARMAMPVILILAAALRLYLMATQPGYPNDMSCFFSWAKRMADVGPIEFYNWDQFSDYPPGYMYPLWITGGLMNLLGVTNLDALGRTVVKIMPMLFDLGAIYLLYRLAKKELSETAAILLSALYALNPAVLLVGAAWGQVDAVTALGLLVTVSFAVKKRWIYALPAYVVTVLMKPQALMVGPLGLAALIGMIANEETPQARQRHWLDAFAGLWLSLGVAVAMLLPFLWGQSNPVGWLIEHYASTLGGYQSATVNAANLFYLMGGNWKPLSDQFLMISYGYWGTALMVAVVAGVIFLYWLKRDIGELPFFGALMFIGLYAFGIMMHERYLFPALLLLAYAYAKRPDRRILWMLAGFSVTLFLNCALVLRDLHLPIGVGFWGGLIALCNVGLAGIGVWVAIDGECKLLHLPEREPMGPSKRLSAVSGESESRIEITLITGDVLEATDGEEVPPLLSEKEPEVPPERLDALFGETDKLPRMRRVDWVLMLSLTLVYAVIAYTGLGNTRAPQTPWKSVPGEVSTAVFDLGEEKDFTMLYYLGINSRDNDSFTVDFSDDMQEWFGEAPAKLNEGDCFKWLYLAPVIYDNLGNIAEWRDEAPLTQTARYVRVRREGPQATVFELGFRDLEGNLLPVSLVPGAGGLDEADPALLIDEQDAVPEYPSFMNGAYFDEIYHARTAYEHLQGMRTFEWTHPPLGKVLIMFGIKIFGMTPFGWRFMGALMGVLMVPAMYFLGHLLFKRTRYAFLAAFIMAFDMMHLTQTRIATIDSYAVLCIIVMYLFMFRYLRMSLFRDGMKTLWPLFFSGLFMGLGCASKWICFYAGIGLAVLFAWSIVQRFLDWRAGMRALSELPEEIQQKLRNFPKALLRTLAACAVFFIAIPAAIYYLSYIPHMAWEGGLTLENFWSEQVRMYGYHANLTAEHAYQSPWYEWPLILRPMWYYHGQFGLGEGNVSSILAMGNPAVWWVGFGCMLYLVYRWLRPHLRGEHVRDHRPALLLISFLAQLVPWLFVSRAIFIYHYFGSLPFVMLSIVMAFERLGEVNARMERRAMLSYMAAVLLMFVGFYPVATGLEVSRGWMDAMNWLKNLRLPGWKFGGWLRY